MITKYINPMKHFTLYALAGILSISVVGCQDLAVENLNNPDRSLAFSQPGDVVNLIRGTFGNYWNGSQDCNAGAFLLSTMADETSCSWGNWGMRDMSEEPRRAWPNSTTYANRVSAEQPWFRNYRGISNANDALQAIARAEEEESVDNNIFTREGHNTAALKAFAKMNQGLMHGTVSLYFDQGFIFDETVNLDNDELDLVKYEEVNKAAIQMLEAARDIAASNSFSINDWIWGLDLSSGDMVKLINSFIARFTVEVARNPAERAAVDWNTVIGLVDAGITETFAPVATPSSPLDCMKFYGQEPASWARADYRTIGPADESGGYQKWLATPVHERGTKGTFFDVHTADRRIVGDANDPTVDGTDFDYEGDKGLKPFRIARGTYHFSSHTHKRYRYYLKDPDTGNAAEGPMPHILLTEMDLYKAEGLLRTGGNAAEVAELLNRTRVNRGEMNPATGSDNPGSPSDDQSHLDSASLWAKLKHERRIELMNSAAGLAYYDDRGWGDLVTGTPIHLPVPGKELETLGLQNYTFGGVGGEGGAPTAYRDSNPGDYRLR